MEEKTDEIGYWPISRNQETAIDGSFPNGKGAKVGVIQQPVSVRREIFIILLGFFMSQR